MAIRVVKLYGVLCLVDTNDRVPYPMHGKIPNAPRYQYKNLKFLEDAGIYRPRIGPYLNDQLVELDVLESARVYQEYKLPMKYFPELMNQYAIVGTAILACYSAVGMWILSLLV